DSVTIGLRVEKTEKILYVNDHLLLVALPRDLALRSWTAEFPPSVVPSPIAPEEEETSHRAPKPMTVPFIADIAMLGETGSHNNRIWADLSFSPGDHDRILPPERSKTRARPLMAT